MVSVLLGAVYPGPPAPLVPLAPGGMTRESGRPLDTLFLTSSTHCSIWGWRWRWREARAACRPAASATCGTGRPGSPGRWQHAARGLGTEGRFQKGGSPHSWWGPAGRAGGGARLNLRSISTGWWRPAGVPRWRREGTAIHITMDTPPETHTLPELQ